MNRLKADIEVKRFLLMKEIAEINKALADTSSSTAVMVGLLEALNLDYEVLRIAEQTIMDMMLDEEVSKEDLKEYGAEAQQCVLQYNVVKATVKERLAVSVSQSSTPSEFVQSSVSKCNYKLPKIELTKFSGDLSDWLTFWAQFEKIHKDVTLDGSDKFQYLIQSVQKGTEAYELVSSFPMTAENYEMAIEALQDRFGDEDLLLQVYVRELLKLVISNVSAREKLPLPRLYTKIETHLRALKTLNLEQADPATWLYPLVESSLPEEVLVAWQRSSESSLDGRAEDPPRTRLDVLMQFLNKEVMIQQRMNIVREGFHLAKSIPGKKDKSAVMKDNQDRSSKKQHAEQYSTAMGLVSPVIEENCVFCSKRHRTEDCIIARDWTIEERRKKLSDHKRCYRCFRLNHSARRCKAFVKCFICKSAFHKSIMCRRQTGEDNSVRTEIMGEAQADATEERPEESAKVALTNQVCTTDVALMTVDVDVLGSHNRRRRVRAFIDTGTQFSHITKRLAREMGYKCDGKVTFSHVLFGGETRLITHQRYKIQLKHVNANTIYEFDVYDQGSICGRVSQNHSQVVVDELANYGISNASGSSEVEILIGADVAGKLLTGNIVQLKCGLTAIETRIGWTVMGKDPVAIGNSAAHSMLNVCSESPYLSMEEMMWGFEAIGIKDSVQKKDRQELDEEAWHHFKSTVSRKADGRYCVSLPWIEEHPELDSNKFVATKRLEACTRKLEQRQMYNEYDGVFEEWLSLDIIEKVSKEDLKKSSHYLPHHAVIKEGSSTTKIRPVFDASCEGRNTIGPRQVGGRHPAGVSLNQCLVKGPSMMEMIPDLLLRFREKPVGATADIKKAFLQIEVAPSDRDFLRFLWWDNEQKPRTLDVYRHNRVVFGLNCSPFLLAAVIEHHMREYCDPDLSHKILRSCYVDNVVTSHETVADYTHFKTSSTAVFAEAKFDLRLWESNSDVNEEDDVSKVLGVKWDRQSDVLFCDVNVEVSLNRITKRSILSALARVFDPLGILAPVTIFPKILLQKCWAYNLKWDDEVPDSIARKFKEWMQVVKLASLVRIRRYFGSWEAQERSLHIFVDASNVGYAAVIYLRYVMFQEVYVSFVVAKARVAPKKQSTINRLELVACQIGTRLVESVKEPLGWKNVPCVYWTDSSTAMAWIRRNDQWGTFVGNRVRNILEASKVEEWRHIPGELNCADLPSRGCIASKLLETDWLQGPGWLRKAPSSWPCQLYKEVEEDIVAERKRTAVTAISIVKEPWYSPKICRASTYDSILRIQIWVLRFLERIKGRKPVWDVKPSVEEIKHAERKLVYQVQRSVNWDVKSFCVDVFEDAEGLLRVRTKLTLREDEEDFKMPLLLPGRHYITNLLIRKLHLENCHSGIQFLMAELRERYWVTRARSSVEQVIRECITCKRYRIGHPKPVAGALPETRVKTAEPFETIGIDFAGPLYLRNGEKVWMVLFTCAVYRAVHLEIATGLSTERFLQALRRFIARRGRPAIIYTDNGTNFTGAYRLLKDVDWQKLQEETAEKRIQWIFIPPSSPWWGGWWERLIRSTKQLLVRMLGKRVLDAEELSTVLCDVEAVINGRPLTYVFEKDSLIPLTPAHLIRGTRSEGVPDIDCLDRTKLIKRCKYRQDLMERLRERFRKEYLGSLVQCKRECKETMVEVGDLVLIGSDNLKRCMWPMGTVIEKIPGKDGVTRLCKVKTSKTVLMRPIQRLYPMEISNREVGQLNELKVTRSGRLVNPIKK